MTDLLLTSHQQTYMDIPSAISSPALESGATPFETPVGQTKDLFGLEAPPVNRSARQAKKAASQTKDTFGQSYLTSSASADLQFSLESRYRAKTGSVGSTMYKLTWKVRTTPAGRSIPALRGVAPRTSGKGSELQELQRSGWCTASARDWKDSAGMATTATNPDGSTRTRLDQLPRQVQLAGWPTTRSSDATAGPDYAIADRPNSGGKSLPTTAALCGWPTPTCQSPNSLRGKGQDPMKRKAQGHTVNLTDAVHYLDTTDQPARLTASGETLTGYSAGMESGGQLDPAHSRWLMGLPSSWDLAAPLRAKVGRAC